VELRERRRTASRSLPCFPSRIRKIIIHFVPIDSLLLFVLKFLQKAGKRVTMCRQIAREVVGLAPYERRILDMIKTGGSSADKRIYKFAKRRLGSHKRALAKREDIKNVNSQQRARAAAH
jgi:large subunit ribosomal protein L36e